MILQVISVFFVDCPKNPDYKNNEKITKFETVLEA